MGKKKPELAKPLKPKGPGLSSLMKPYRGMIALLIFLAFFVISDHRQWWQGSIVMVVGFALTITPFLSKTK